jgi:predicted nucleic acid-binding protein
MIFVDTNVFMYAVGRSHPLQEEARTFFSSAATDQEAIYTSSEVMQELLHAYLPVNRMATLDNALDLITRTIIEVWPLEADDTILARQLHDQYPEHSARDLCHFASCRRRGVSTIKTFDRGLAIMAARFF